MKLTAKGRNYLETLFIKDIKPWYKLIKGLIPLFDHYGIKEGVYRFTIEDEDDEYSPLDIKFFSKKDYWKFHTDKDYIPEALDLNLIMDMHTIIFAIRRVKNHYDLTFKLGKYYYLFEIYPTCRMQLYGGSEPYYSQRALVQGWKAITNNDKINKEASGDVK